MNVKLKKKFHILTMGICVVIMLYTFLPLNDFDLPVPKIQSTQVQHIK